MPGSQGRAMRLLQTGPKADRRVRIDQPPKGGVTCEYFPQLHFWQRSVAPGFYGFTVNRLLAEDHLPLTGKL
jgi:hypothetical protein